MSLQANSFGKGAAMKIEHVGICVPAPVSMGYWYRDHLGFEMLMQAGDDRDGVSFISDGEGTVLELGRLPEGPPLEARSLAPLQLHIAVDCDVPVREAERLVAAGATLVGESPRNSYPGEKVLVRDPWGFVLQLVNRKRKLS
jgi:catechol 2,3-dioxygenase-like lactoylglutathione lyase family enzyme